MHKAVLTFSFAALIGAGALQAQNTSSAEALANYQAVRTNIMKAAEKMPEDSFGFKPTPAVRNFGELIAHVADAQMGICGVVKGEMKRVSWPSWKQVRATTGVVIAATFLFAAYFFVVDYVVNSAVKKALTYFTHH